MEDPFEAAGNFSKDSIVCYAPTMVTTNGVWQGDNPLDYSLPLFISQITLVIVTTRSLVFALKPLRQPRVISEILGGIILGPSILGQSKTFANSVFPTRSVLMLETMANVGLLYFLFLIGVEMDITVIRRTGEKALCIAVAGMVLPFIAGFAFSYVMEEKSSKPEQGTFILFLGVILSVTSFPVLARILAELKLVNAELGRLAMSSALINDICAWVFLAVAIAFAENGSASLAFLWMLLLNAAFVVFCIFAVRPAIWWIIRATPEGEPVSEFHLCLILTGVMVAGCITDAIGTHSMFGAFVFGLIIPNGHLGVTIIEKLEDFVSGLLLPLFFALSGLKTDLSIINGTNAWGVLAIVISIACAGKIAGTVAVTAFYKMPLREAITLGFLMNTKGLEGLIILNIGKDQKVLDAHCFAILVIVSVAMTGIIMPIVTIIHRPARRFVHYKRRTIQSSTSSGELRILVCVHTPRYVPAIINLLKASHSTRKTPISVYVVHLVELTGRASAMLIVHNARKSSSPAHNRTHAQSDHIIQAFENYEQHATCVSVQHLTAISPYPTMHEDISNLAEDKRVGFIIIPFHKQQTVDGELQVSNPAFRMVNQNVLANAPCSVGILVDRGLSGPISLAPNQPFHRVAVLFFGGPDDREALSYARRLSEHPEIILTVMRFLPGEDAMQMDGSADTEINAQNEKRLDEQCISDFRVQTSNNQSIIYEQMIVNNCEETVAAIRSMDNRHDLFIVGRGQGKISPLTAGLTDWSECPELGAIGDLLASSDSELTVSVLIVQQYVALGAQGGG